MFIRDIYHGNYGVLKTIIILILKATLVLYWAIGNLVLEMRYIYLNF